MPEIDANLRIDGRIGRKKYHSLLDEFSPQRYRAYEAEWREEVDHWFSQRPDLNELLPKLRQTWGSIREARKLLQGPIVKHLHDEVGLSLPMSLHMQSYFATNTPTRSLVTTLFPDIHKELEVTDANVQEQLSQWGFDRRSLSPTTGKLTNQPIDPMRFWRDETVLTELGQPISPPKPGRRDARATFLPMLASFDAPLKASESLTVTIEYDIQLSLLRNPFSSTFRFGGVPELAMALPSPEDAKITVSCPLEIHPVINPAPTSVNVTEEGQREFEIGRQRDGGMLHLIPIGMGKDPDSWLMRFPRDDRTVVQDLRTLIEKSANATVRPLLMSALYSVLLHKNQPWEAHQVALKTVSEHPEFKTILAAIQNRSFRGKETQRQYEWVLAKSSSPSLDSDDDLNRFRQRSGNDEYVLSARALTELARAVKGLKEDDLSLNEKMGRYFILCQSGIDSKGNLAKLIELAKSNPKSAVDALKLLQFLSVDKSEALPYVLAQIDVKINDKLRSGQLKSTSFEYARHISAYHTLRSFRSPKAAAGIIAFIHTTDSTLLIQGAVDALNHMKLPAADFEKLVGIADQAAVDVSSTTINYLDVVIRTDQTNAIPFLNRLRKQNPKIAASAMRALAKIRHKAELPRAIAAYQKSDDIRGELPSAISVLTDLATPKDIAKLEYRKGLPNWMNESLTSIIRRRGGDESQFPFVKAYYLEHIRGKGAHNHLTCVAAFERIGDQRAIPYLREVFSTTERKRDAAIALGSLLLPKTVSRKYTESPLERHVRLVFDDKVSKAEKEAAWAIILADPEAAWRRVTGYIAYDESATFQRELDNNHRDFITRFGDIAVQSFLVSSEGCSLKARYEIAKRLAVTLPASRKIIEAEADNSKSDPDRRKTAQLALKMFYENTNE